jgi:hypothetical protein
MRRTERDISMRDDRQEMISKKKAALLGQALLRNPLEFWDRIITQAEFQMDKIRRPFVHNTMDPATLIQVLGERMETGALTPDHLRSRWQLEQGRTPACH